ncbi:MAG: homoserine dehydrogenase [Clostridia bacterium]|nr:homoserine dehydrogenase [Clostridia bacterium]
MNIAVLGHGTVGSGVVETIESKNKKLSDKTPDNSIDIKYILDLNDFPELSYCDKFTKDFQVILNDESVKVVVETIGGINPAFEYTMQAIQKGKSVVSSNKELVATKGFEILKAAEENNVNYFFEASVGGGIPIIRPISNCLAANKIDRVTGILNGTTNFIFSKMIDDKMSFEEALKLAQDNGYAEKDPTDDIEGFDAMRKICILSSLCYGHHIYPKEVYSEGISKIKNEDIYFANDLGFVIKLIADSQKIEDDKIQVITAPMLVDKHNQLANVNGVFNAVLVNGDATGEVLFYGKGAGKMPTASAVVADVLDCANHLKKRKNFGWGEHIDNFVADYLDRKSAFYLRAETENYQKSVEEIQQIFEGKCTISEEKNGQFAFITPIDTERNIENLKSKIKKSSIVAILRCLEENV